MATNSDDSQITCWLCEKSYSIKPTTSLHRPRYKQNDISLCPDCEQSYLDKKAKLYDQSRVWIKDHLEAWLTKTKSVNRFYNRQTNLFVRKP